jgi:putative aldouronate transport system permease protein
MVTAADGKRKTIMRSTAGDKVFDAVNYTLMTIFLLIMIYPLYFVFIASISDINQIGLGNVVFFPIGVNFDSYIQVLNHNDIWVGYRNSLLYASLSVLYNITLLLPLAYALSKKYLFARNYVTWFFMVPMFFTGGLIPAYLLRAIYLDLSNTVAVMILGSVSFFQVVITRTFFMSTIPDEMYEAAEIDGASQYRCFFRIALPLSTPIIAVMALFIAVGTWNAFFGAMIYLTQRERWPLQLVLRSILILFEPIPPDSDLFLTLSPEQMQEQAARANLALSMRYSTVYIGSLPLLIAYPFVQKYFVKGIMIGSLKG